MDLFLFNDNILKSHCRKNVEYFGLMIFETSDSFLLRKASYKKVITKVRSVNFES